MCASYPAPVAIGQGEEGGRIQLFPCGEFFAKDGRPANLKGVKTKVWRITRLVAEKLIADFATRQNGMVVDYEHQTFLAAQNGQPAPAAGWIRALEWIEGQGLFAKVDWTEKARGFLENGEYMYISPTFHFDPVSGEIVELLNAALTNYPALDGMEPARAKGEFMGFLQQLKKALGLADAATEADIVALVEEKGAAKFVESLSAKGDEPEANPKDGAKQEPEKKTEDKADSGQDPVSASALASIAALEARVKELGNSLASLSKENMIQSRGAAIEAALADGRLPANAKEWAYSLAVTNPTALGEFLELASPVAALKGTQTSKTGVPGTDEKRTPEEETVFAQLGI